MAKVKIQLVLGEKDGLELELSPGDVPQVYYAVPNLDEEKIKNTKGNDAKREMRDKLGILAYRYDALSSSPDTFRMVRCPSLDKISSL